MGRDVIQARDLVAVASVFCSKVMQYRTGIVILERMVAEMFGNWVGSRCWLVRQESVMSAVVSMVRKHIRE